MWCCFLEAIFVSPCVIPSQFSGFATEVFSSVGEILIHVLYTTPLRQNHVWESKLLCRVRLKFFNLTLLVFLSCSELYSQHVVEEAMPQHGITSSEYSLLCMFAYGESPLVSPAEVDIRGVHYRGCQRCIFGYATQWGRFKYSHAQRHLSCAAVVDIWISLTEIRPSITKINSMASLG